MLYLNYNTNLLLPIVDNLTLTSVVFELNTFNHSLIKCFNLTLTSVVFEYDDIKEISGRYYDLTLTSVVFEYSFYYCT